MDAQYGIKNIIPEVTLVVDMITGRTERVHKVLPTFGVQVWVKERSMERENWPWSWLTVRRPRLIKRYPRPFRFPRAVPTQQCHCKIGRMEVENVEERRVRCTRCEKLVGCEAYPRRIERAEDFLRRACLRIERENKVQGGISRRTRKISRRSKSSRKVGKSRSSLGVQSKRRRDEAKSASKKKAARGRRLRQSRKGTSKIPKARNSKVSKTKKKALR